MKTERLFRRLLVAGAVVAACSGAAPRTPAVAMVSQDSIGTSTNTVGIRLAQIPAGEFVMGSPAEEPGREHDEALHAVHISKSFQIGVTEVTQSQWTAVMGKRQGAFEGADRPVESVSWKDAASFCERLSKLENRTYRLPTEAEWEYVCRAGTSGGAAMDGALTDLAWVDENADDTTHAVCGRKPNAWGIYDMRGNVAEWCGDYYSATYPTEPQTDPAGPREGTARVTRGGSFASFARGCRCAARSSMPESYALKFVGFRVVAEAGN
jgi:formylglycine-generating enzyme required for sulfatase activity